MTLLEKIALWQKQNNKEITDLEGYLPKYFGEGKSITYEIDGLVKGFATVTEWPNGEGFDFEVNQEKRISLHLDELECIFAGLNHLKYFG